MTVAGRVLPSELMATDGTPKKTDRLLKTSTWSLKNTKLLISLLIAFTAATCLTAFYTQRMKINWKGIIALNTSWQFPKPATAFRENEQLPSFPNSPESKNKTLVRNFSEKHDEGFEHSESFKDFVKSKNGNFSSVAAYLDSINTYLQDFRSPMIRENPFQYSWPQTDDEKKRYNASVATKRIVWYNPPGHFPRQQMFDRCPVKDCILTFNYKETHTNADAVILLGQGVKDKPPRDHANQVYIYMSMESPWHTGSAYRTTSLNKAFNWTWNYRVDSDIFEPVGYLKRSPSVPTHSTLLSLKRRKTKQVAWISSNCNVQSKRDQYVQRLRKIIHVDIYGHCGTLSCPRGEKRCSKMLNDYLFYLSFENSMCVDYITEKYYKTFADDLNVLPVVRGGANYSRFFPAGTFIDAETFSGPEELGRYLLQLAQNEAAYVDMMWRMAHFAYLEHGILDTYCQLCYKLHHLDRFKRTYSDMYGWFHKDKCFSPKPF